ncbi:hypothetical protein SR1949_51640 [Sphaerospermopsis reniformis]|uniref:Uncharacterized protein n=1 Tax=Sphaerospermopsis reniformis TaxID=531300 RepID=A0A480A4R8_9CYAN|nr:hypothetical protein [Sphaerospermopsis reniformis]GCL40030.1 hypothetical protein SR1949_51640 [Sphaerospermopsis reniformis]
MTNEEIRNQYNKQVSEGISKLEADIKRQKRIPNMTDAKKAWEIRHQARIDARAKMKASEAMKLRARDMKKYGHPNGPTFSYEVEKARSKGKGDVPKSIINSGKRTNEKWNNPRSITEALRDRLKDRNNKNRRDNFKSRYGKSSEANRTKELSASNRELKKSGNSMTSRQDSKSKSRGDSKPNGGGGGSRGKESRRR